jgi:hypothetical protein
MPAYTPPIKPAPAPASATNAQIQTAIQQYVLKSDGQLNPVRQAQLMTLATTNPIQLQQMIGSYLPANTQINPQPQLQAQQQAQAAAAKAAADAQAQANAAAQAQALANQQAANQQAANQQAANQQAANKSTASTVPGPVAPINQAAINAAQNTFITAINSGKVSQSDIDAYNQAVAAAGGQPQQTLIGRANQILAAQPVNPAINQARTTLVNLINSGKVTQADIDSYNKTVKTAGGTPDTGVIDLANKQLAYNTQQAQAQQQNQFNNQAMQATTQAQLDAATAAAKAAGITIDPSAISHANASIQQAQQQKFDSQAQAAQTQADLDSATAAAKAAGITINPAVIQQAKTHIQQNTQIQAFASKLGTPTGSDVVGPNGSHFYSIPDDPVTGAKGGWYQDTGNGNMQAIGSDGAPSGPVIPNQQYNATRNTAQNDVQVYNQQQTAQQAALKLATDTASFEKALPQPGSQQFQYLLANAFEETAPNGDTYKIMPSPDASRGGYWVKSNNNGQTFTSVSDPTAKPITAAQVNANYAQAAQAVGQAQRDAWTAAVNAQVNPDTGGGLGDLFQGIDQAVNDIIPGGWSTLATVAGGALGGPLGAALANATAGAVKGETPGQILKGAAISFAAAYGTQALSDALAGPVTQTQAGIADGSVQPAAADPATAPGTTPPENTIPDPKTLTDTPVTSVDTITQTPAAPAEPVAPAGPAEPAPVEPAPVTPAEPAPATPAPAEPVVPAPNPGEIQISDTGERFIVNADGTTSPYNDPNLIQTGNPPQGSVSIEPAPPASVAPAPAPAPVTPVDVNSLDLSSYTPDELRDLTPTEISQLTPETIAKLSPDQLSVLGITAPTPVSPIDPTTVLTPIQIAALGGTAAAAAIIASSGAAGAATAANTAIAAQAPVVSTPGAPVTSAPAPISPIAPHQPYVYDLLPPGGTTTTPGGTSTAPGGTSTAPGGTSTIPGGTTPGGTTPGAPEPVNPAPVNPAPVNPAPVNPAPVNPAPVNPAPVNPAPVEPPTTTTPEQGKPPSLGENYTGNALEPAYTFNDGTPADVTGLSAAQIAALVAGGFLLLGALRQPPTPNIPKLGTMPTPTFNGAGLVNPGVNPGFIEPAPAYAAIQPGINQYAWNQHQYAQTMSDLANLNSTAPAQAYGNPNAVNLGRLVTPEQINYPNAGTMAQIYGPNGVYNPQPILAQDQYSGMTQLNQAAPAVPGFATAFGPNTQAQQAAGSGLAAQIGGGLNYVAYPSQAIGYTGTPPAGQFSTTPQPSSVSPENLTAQLNAAALAAMNNPINYWGQSTPTAAAKP